MRWKLSLIGLTFIISACTGTETPLPLPEAGPVSEAEPGAPTDTPASEPVPTIPTNTPAPLADDTPLPPAIAAPVVTSPSITYLHMLDELNGWAITGTAILRTTDGGSTWYSVSPQGVTEFGYGTANTFLSDLQAWVIVTDWSDPVGSGLLYRTSDGGLTWTVYTVPFGGGELVFLDQDNGWMMAFLGIAAGSMGVSIYKTDDGGATWKQTYTNDPNLENASDSLPLGGIKNNLTPLDEQTAWVGGVIYAPETFYLYKTDNGGQTWSPQTLPAAPGMQDMDVAIDKGPVFTSLSDGILPVRFMGETYRTGFYATNDGGENWEFVSFMPGAGVVDFVSPSEGFFWTGDQFFTTLDGAHTWSSINSDVLFGESFAGMDFVNTRTGWVWTYDQTGQYSLYKTTDGGVSWVSMD